MTEANASEGDAVQAALARLRSPDVLAQNEALSALVRAGRPAVAPLAGLLDAQPAGVRAQAMYALAQIADPSAADAFARGLDDQDERVRAYAATGLAALGSPGALRALLATIDDGAEPAHADVTPAVGALAGLGRRAIPALLDLLESERETTRLHAQRALEAILEREHGFVPGRGFPAPAEEAAMRAEWRANGSYDYAAAPAARAAAIAAWRGRLGAAG